MPEGCHIAPPCHGVAVGRTAAGNQVQCQDRALCNQRLARLHADSPRQSLNAVGQANVDEVAALGCDMGQELHRWLTDILAIHIALQMHTVTAASSWGAAMQQEGFRFCNEGRTQMLHSLIQGLCKTLSGAEQSGSTMLGKASNGISAAAAWCMDHELLRSTATLLLLPEGLTICSSVSISLLSACTITGMASAKAWCSWRCMAMWLSMKAAVSVTHGSPAGRQKQSLDLFWGMCSREALRWQHHRLDRHSCTADTHGLGLPRARGRDTTGPKALAADAAPSCQASPEPQVPFTICTSLGTVLSATSIWHVLAWGVSR